MKGKSFQLNTNTVLQQTLQKTGLAIIKVKNVEHHCDTVDEIVR